MSKLPLTNRADFFEVLEQTRVEVEGLVNKDAPPGPLASIAKQLGVIKSQTANGRTPTEDERDAISIGLIAVRELEPASDEAMSNLMKRLHELNGYFREWPDT